MLSYGIAETARYLRAHLLQLSITLHDVCLAGSAESGSESALCLLELHINDITAQLKEKTLNIMEQ